VGLVAPQALEVRPGGRFRSPHDLARPAPTKNGPRNSAISWAVGLGKRPRRAAS
jgi:hypothetical protein